MCEILRFPWIFYDWSAASKEGRIETRPSACKKVGIIDGVGDTLVGNWQIGYTRAARNSKNSNGGLLLVTTTTHLKYGGIALP